MTGFGARLAQAKASRGPLCLGIDPHPDLLRAWDLPATADGLAAFCDTCVEAFAGFAVVKPQVAFFEAYGSAGYAVLERTMRRFVPPAYWCWPTPNAATSGQRWPPTPPPGRAIHRWPPTP